jgi:CO/xanthine dehydrogenase Mo-binding subunit
LIPQPSPSNHRPTSKLNHDFAEYHIATNAAAAAIANGAHYATGIRVRDLPISLDKLLR